MNETQNPLELWDRIAIHYLSIVDSAPHNALYERPAMVRLIGDVHGIRALDVGCGSGYYLQWLLDHGVSRAAGIDGSQNMVEASLRRTNKRAAVMLCDLEQPLRLLETGGFDLIVASLVLHYLEQWGPILGEFERLLSSRGTVVVSVSHPMADFESSVSKNYFEIEKIFENWDTFGITMPSYRRSFESMDASFRDAGFIVTHLIEPKPLPEMMQIKPKSYAKLSSRPGFLCVKLRKVQRRSE
jgi:SAM-dependent methyltransferase